MQSQAWEPHGLNRHSCPAVLQLLCPSHQDCSHTTNWSSHHYWLINAGEFVVPSLVVEDINVASGDLIQDRPAEKPICICISNVEQLVAAKPPFSPLLWEFMRNVYPGGISCIVSKGDWLFKL
ncbi:hypothetical protein FQN60_010387 [Etheostoma spectabile]|uniref:Uncharacterized protein n=1 Tax=Etheostoma spectabile TaxID=54343 RepID=A0A5J5D2U7_9PERO|nr:hypothetical protein FQN60_010387 [Etheostoma spectabile]